MLVLNQHTAITATAQYFSGMQEVNVVFDFGEAMQLSPRPNYDRFIVKVNGSDTSEFSFQMTPANHATLKADWLGPTPTTVTVQYIGTLGLLRYLNGDIINPFGPLACTLI